MNLILSYRLPSLPGLHKIKVREGAKILSCGNLGENIIMWAQVKYCSKEVEKEFALILSGERFDALPEGDYKFIGTVTTTCVFHIFEVNNQTKQHE